MNGDEAPKRLRRAETILNGRISRIILVLEQCIDSHNHQAVLRTAEAMGIQNVWVIAANSRQMKRKIGKNITKNCSTWLSMRTFDTIKDCIAALREQKCEIWATDLAPEAVGLDATSKPSHFPSSGRLALVIGRESDGVSQEMLQASDRRVYLPMFGFTESFNLSVATALILQRILDWFPQIRGDLSHQEREEIRSKWYKQLLNNPTAREEAKHWIQHPEEIKPLDDLRREPLDEARTNLWIPRNIRERETVFPQVQDRKVLKTT